MNLGPNQEKWLSALESDKYQQGMHSLCKKDNEGVWRYCCLGVLLEEFNLFTQEYCYFKLSKSDLAASLSVEEQNLVGLRSCTGMINNGDGKTLASLNDTGTTFKEIVKFIRENSETVFADSI